MSPAARPGRGAFRPRRTGKDQQLFHQLVERVDAGHNLGQDLRIGPLLHARNNCFDLGLGLFFGRPDGTVDVVPRFGRFADQVNDVNRRGDVVGRDAFVWFGLGTAGILYTNTRLAYIGAMFGTLSVNVQSAYAITDGGYILASARIANGPSPTCCSCPSLLRPQH